MELIFLISKKLTFRYKAEHRKLTNLRKLSDGSDTNYAITFVFKFFVKLKSIMHFLNLSSDNFIYQVTGIG